MMKKRWLALLLTGAMAVSLTACGSAETAAQSTTEEDVITNGVYVSTDLECTLNAVGENAITVTTENGEQFTVNLSDSVVYSYTMPSANDMQGDPGSTGPGDNGQASAMTDGASGTGSAPEMPNGENNPQGSGDGSTPPAKPDGDSSQGGNSPEMTNGENNPQGSSDGSTPPEMPNGNNSQGGNSPEMPNGENNPQGSGDGSTPPEMPNGNSSQGGSAPEMPTDGSGQSGSAAEMPADGNLATDDATSMEASFDSLKAGETITLTFDENGEVTAIAIHLSMEKMGGQPGENGMGGNGQPGENGMGGGQPNGGSGAPTEYSAANTYTEDTELTGETVTSTGDDENAILVQGGNVTMDSMTIERDSDSSTGGDNSSFYGVGAAVLATDGTATITNSTITTDAKGGAGAFAYGDGTVYISDTDITTTQDTSGGIHVAGGGTLYAWDLNVETSGESSAAIRSDRGSGTMVVDGGTYTSNGVGSPAIYSTADITVNNATLTANGSEAICIEGLNTIRLYDCSLTGSMADNEQNDCTWNVILYQSMSGDSEQGNSTFEMVGGTLTAKNGGMFYTTNTESTFVLKNVDITNAENAAFLLRCTGNSNARGWGSTGSNGADCTFTAIEQTLEGDVIWDSISNLNMYLTENSTLTGAFVDDESCAGNGGNGSAALTIDEGSTWVVTGDSTLTTLNNAGTIVDANGNTVTIQGTDGTVYVQGTSETVITVSAYNTSADLSGASEAHSFSDYEVNRAA